MLFDTPKLVGVVVAPKGFRVLSPMEKEDVRWWLLKELVEGCPNIINILSLNTDVFSMFLSSIN
ncbi:hypothetical protein BDB01DRAFT_33221 [Pilobolus umbonatus]|nr:hypothetical protein BDB01DRAFT_33221 [Pilobolus umbonatus]